MALTPLSERSVVEGTGAVTEEAEQKIAASAVLETPGCSGAGTRFEQGSRSESSCEGNEEVEDEEEMMEEEAAERGTADLFGRFGTEEGEMDSDEGDERMINLSELVPYIMCSICKGYFIDATTITECLHTFCKSCIVRHFYYSNRCPKCNIVVHQTQPLYNIRLDRQLQDIVYKLVTNLEEREKKRMHEFYRERGLEIPKLAIPQPIAVGRGRPRKVVGSVFRIPPELDMSLLLEFIGANDLSGNFKPLEKKFIRVSGEATIGHVEKFLRRKMDLDPGCQVHYTMEELIVELQLFLQLLDHEYLTSTVREKKAVLNNILLRIQATKDVEIKENMQKQEIAISLPAPPQMPLPEIPQQWLPPDNGPPPLPSSSLPEGYYEEAVPLSPGKAPEYITSNYDSDAMSSSYESYDEEDEDGKGKKMRHQWPSEEASMDLVKDAKICAFLLRKKRFGQWTKLLCVIKENKLLCYKSSKEQQPQMELLLCDCSITYIPKDSKKKKHELKIAHQGQDALVLAVQSKEQADQWLKVIKEVCSTYVGTVDSDGLSSNSVHKTDLEKKLSSERPSSDGEGVVENGITTVCNGKEHVKRKKSSKMDSKGAVSKVTGKKITKIIGLGKKKPSTDEQTSSAEEDIPTCGYLNVLSNNRWRERWCRVKDNKLIFHKDRTDLKTRIVSIPLCGCEVIPGLDSKHPLTFRLLRNAQEVAVLEASSSEDMGRWIGILLAESGSSADPGTLHYDYIDVDVTASVIQAAKQTFCFMNRRVLSTNPYRGNAANGYACPSGMALHYDDVPCINGSWEPEDGFPTSCSRNTGEDGLYDNMGLYDNLPSPKIFARCPPAERKTNRLSTDKLSSNHYKYPISSNLSSAQSVTNTFAVGRGSLAQFKGKKMPVAANGISGKGRTLSNSPQKSEFASNVKRSNSNADQYKYGKNRVEADAKRLQTKEEELLKKKESLRSHLAQLRKERKDLRAALEMNPGRKSLIIIEDKLKKLEEECKLKESERVSLELELTEVKENLKKALAGGITLGLAIEPKSQSPVLKHQTLENSPISSCDTSDTECSVPSNSAIVLKRHSSSNTSPCRGHVRQKAKEWEMKNGT